MPHPSIGSTGGTLKVRATRDSSAAPKSEHITTATELAKSLSTLITALLNPFFSILFLLLFLFSFYFLYILPPPDNIFPE
jgi:hypothetical protein